MPENIHKSKKKKNMLHNNKDNDTNFSTCVWDRYLFMSAIYSREAPPNVFLIKKTLKMCVFASHEYPLKISKKCTDHQCMKIIENKNF